MIEAIPVKSPTTDRHAPLCRATRSDTLRKSVKKPIDLLGRGRLLSGPVICKIKIRLLLANVLLLRRDAVGS